MRRLQYIIPILFASCGQTSNNAQEQTFEASKKQVESSEKSFENGTVTFKEHDGIAVLIGDKIDILNNELQEETTLNESSIVEIVGISESQYQKTDDYCDAFRYVKIKTDSQNGIIDGRNVYQLTESKQDTSFNYKDKKFDFMTTSFYGIGVADDDGLTFCSKYYEPIVLNESGSNQPKLIEIIKNDFSKEASWSDDFKYFELMANDGAYDKIKMIEQTENGVVLTIKREFQEGWNEFQVQFTLSKQLIKQNI
ncbi:hypothetical protein FIA58_010960 [Flavobacterium jejuense]|uniref:Lipoprotein n=1 Tax=Flavobacterium jejuense TaxID=1544455 RepID=A0ABX0IQR5_9FLAO|nr:hypothetical protein [Flavobacterium jejuense]NHN26197.1 hypothetical protein [Flavobacterium jejuense]